MILISSQRFRAFLKSIPAPFRDRRNFPRLALAGLMAFALLVNAAEYYKKYTSLRALRQQEPYIFFGVLYSGLEDILKGQSAIGYFSDKDMTQFFNALQFAQAQYVLAPIVLDNAVRDHEYILFDYSSTPEAVKAAQSLGAQPLKVSPYGTILARAAQHALDPQAGPPALQRPEDKPEKISEKAPQQIQKHVPNKGPSP